ncbi:hypothetical protein [Solitalea lacus]|uniref:hypothetical protein n=1 Tax=Solitalea lacus TaxID=2911172 RepID=UPI001ED9DA7D|nr:hypothetical protein [Solitalea lacus]UKJ07159.1 hypothetical protein L2B55_16730 [Solitalea lacus]
MLRIQKHYLRNYSFLLKPLLLLLLIISSCSPLIASYNEHVYRELTSLKVETNALIGKATNDYTNPETEIEQLDKDLQKLHEYIKGLPKNAETTKMMDIMINGDGRWEGIKKVWKSSGKLSKAATGEFQAEIAEGFNDMLQLESRKIK